MEGTLGPLGPPSQGSGLSKVSTEPVLHISWLFPLESFIHLPDDCANSVPGFGGQGRGHSGDQQHVPEGSELPLWSGRHLRCKQVCRRGTLGDCSTRRRSDPG